MNRADQMKVQKLRNTKDRWRARAKVAEGLVSVLIDMDPDLVQKAMDKIEGKAPETPVDAGE